MTWSRGHPVTQLQGHHLYICLLARACLLSSQFDFISGIQRFKLASSEQWYSISQVSFCKQTLLLVVQAVVSLHVPPFGLTYLSEAHKAHLSFRLSISCGSDLQFYSLKNQSRVIDWVSMEVAFYWVYPLWTVWPLYSDSIIPKSVILVAKKGSTGCGQRI